MADAGRREAVLVRVRRRLRKGLFAPGIGDGCPVDVGRLAKSRETHVVYKDGTQEDIRDQLDGRENHRSLGKTWTGTTSFRLARSETDQVAMNKEEYDIHLSDEVVEEFEQEVLREGLEPKAEGLASSDIFSVESVSTLGHAVPDTACRKSLVGEYTLAGMQQCLRTRGYKVEFRDEVNDFRFGNAGVIRSEKVVKLPLTFGEKRVDVHVAVLLKGGSHTPLLLSKEFLKWLGAVIDTGTNTMYCKALRQRIRLAETGGHGMRRIWILFDLEQPRGFDPTTPHVNDSNCTSRIQMTVTDSGFHNVIFLLLAILVLYNFSCCVWDAEGHEEKIRWKNMSTVIFTWLMYWFPSTSFLSSTRRGMGDWYHQPLICRAADSLCRTWGWLCLLPTEEM